MAGIMKNGKPYGGTVTDDYIKSLVPEAIRSNPSLNLKTLDNGYRARITEVDTGLIIDYFKDGINSDINRLYLGNDGKTLKLQKYSNNVIVDDYDLCKTKVKDKDATSFTFNLPSQLTLQSQSNMYYIRNGICYIDIKFIIIGSTGSVSWENVSNNELPKPIYGFTEQLTTVNGIHESIALNFLQDGSVVLYTELNTVTSPLYYYLRTSYPVLES